uniref:Tumor necrosis factor receptor superfamily member 3-like isoform X2 n=1 Tax=Petromyzon marinus TaxID=7757 RepID=A0AAJ7XH51_PETMA|nr:tumor necrosis factor receptor superfamily member 3-like isoform X2 [Petromyzon marinus]
MMMLAVHSAVLLGISLGAVQASDGFCNPFTQYPMDGHCCDKCPPGSFRSAWCTVDTPTRCQPCPEGSYTSEYNTNPMCSYCTRCVQACNQVKIEDCIPTRNARCGCGKDQNITKLSANGTFFWCCPNCPAGMEMLNECSYTDFVTKCTDCPPGTFSDRPGSRCRNCTRCERELAPCTNATDAVCSDPDVSANGKAHAAIAAGAAVSLSLLVAVMMVLMLLHSRRASVQHKDAPLSDSSSMEKLSTQGSSATLQRPDEQQSMLNACNDIEW